ncbi:MAG: DUF2752 domain-containing protein [Planctomycetota bacterium]|nr:MAG: DUF2752 domain-containing protein [Planctomycetota bacterium]REJ95481.1 MAG: DUF2752 domain-containing protein [Planctomycetota bacterium]REK26524.1 MAG: DUF2752 domain-containing protein [Planctomycetota bacterium]REK33977.1 MAG: DUF2752 domain-containing protein [Planctomycetota bacterium]
MSLLVFRMAAELQRVPAHSESPEAAGRQTRDTRHDDYHRLFLWGSIAVVVLAFVMSVREDQRVGLGFLPDWPLPELCQSKSLLGWNCPGCGLTRSFIYLAHGELAASLQVHRVGWLLALGVVLQIPYRLWALRSPSGLPLGRRLPTIAGICVLILLIANWLADVIVRAS